MAFEGTTQISASEAIATLLVLSQPMAQISIMEILGFPYTKTDLAMRVAARILGSRSFLTASAQTHSEESVWR
jgi:hypothetical protein